MDEGEIEFYIWQDTHDKDYWVVGYRWGSKTGEVKYKPCCMIFLDDFEDIFGGDILRQAKNIQHPVRVLLKVHDIEVG